MDRFDEMRAKIVKESGGSGGGGGSTGYNVFSQTSEPTKKDGIWIKSGGGSDTVYFSQNMTSQGQVIDGGNFTFLNSSDKTYAQIVVGDYLYSFDNTNPKKYNLRTKELVGSINFPKNVTTMQAYYYKGKIYVAGNNIGVYIYDPDTDYTEPFISVGSANTGDVYYFVSAFYNGEIYFYTSCYYTAGYHSPNKINLDTLEVTSIPGLGNMSASSAYYVLFSCVSIGEYIYTLQMRTDTTSESYNVFTRNKLGVSESKKLSFPPEFGAIYGTGNFIYLFPSGKNKTTYYIYDVENDTWTAKESTVPFSLNYSMASGNRAQGNGNERSRYQPCVYDEKTGLLYLRSDSYSTTAFQFENSPLSAGLDDGTTVIVESFNSRPVLIQDSSNLAVGVSDVAIIKDGELNGDLVVFYGNGEEWRLLKGLVRVTLDTGDGTSYVSAKYGETISEPPAPSKEGYEFECWTLNGSEYDFSTPITEPITLEARWIEANPTFVDYIESTGTQYINTGINLTSTHNIVFDGYAKNEASMYGVTSTNSEYKLNFIGSNQYRIIRRKTGASDGYSILSSSYSANVRHVFRMDNNKLYIDDTLVATLTSYEITCDIPLYIFAVNNQGSASISGSTRCYSFKIYDNGSLVRDFKPCHDTRGVYCMYDTVTKKYYYNKGTGEFRGSDWQPTYIESTATQYIDTGFKPNPTTTKVVAELEFTNNTVATQGVFGVRPTTALSSDSCNIFWNVTSGKIRPDWCGKNDDSLNVAVSLNNKVTITCENNIVTVGTTTRTGNVTKGTNYLDYSMFIGNHNEAGSPFVQGVYAKWYSFKIYDNNTLVRDYIPAIDSNGTVCLYDKVSETYFYNKGTGSFTVG